MHNIFIRNFFLALFLIFSSSQLFSQAGTWASGFGGKLGEVPNDIASDNSGNTYLTGYFQDTLLFPSGPTLVSAGNTDFFVASYDNTGTIRWAKKFGGPSDEFGRTIAVDDAGNCWVGGEFFDSTMIENDTLFTTNPIANFDLIIIKLDLSGNYDTVFHVDSTGGGDFINKIVPDNNGNIVFTGKFRGVAVFGPDTLVGKGFDDFFLSKMTDQGQILWGRSFGGGLYEQGNDLAIVGDSVYYVTGFFQDSCYFRDSTFLNVSIGLEDIFLVKFSDDGVFRWVKTCGGPGSDKGNSILSFPSGEIYVGGLFDSLLYCGADSIVSAGSQDILIMKTDLAGNLAWLRSAGGEDMDLAWDLSKAGSNIACTGYIQGVSAFDTITIGISGINTEAYVAGIDVNGNWLWANSGKGPSLDEGRALTEDSDGFLVTLGIFNDTIIFGQAGLNSRGSEDCFLVRMNQVGGVQNEGQKELIQTGNLMVWPNPGSGEFFIRAGSDQEYDLEIYDVSGSLISVDRTSDNAHISKPNLSNGLYFLKVLVKDEVYCGKLLISN